MGSFMFSLVLVNLNQSKPACEISSFNLKPPTFLSFVCIHNWSSAPVYYCEHKQKVQKKWERSGIEATTFCRTQNLGLTCTLPRPSVQTGHDLFKCVLVCSMSPIWGWRLRSSSMMCLGWTQICLEWSRAHAFLYCYSSLSTKR